MRQTWKRYAEGFELCNNIYLMYISEKFLVDFYGKIRRSHTVLARSKLFEEKKKFFFSGPELFEEKM